MRPTRDKTWISVAHQIAERATCLRRHVGCVLVNKRGHVLATGYNGVAAGVPHCNAPDEFDPRDGACGYPEIFPHACLGAAMPSGQGLDQCQAIHAEQNALLQCGDVWDIHTCYVTVSPCLTCVKLLMNTSCKRIVFAEEYVHAEAKELWLNSKGDRTWEQLD